MALGLVFGPTSFVIASTHPSGDQLEASSDDERSVLTSQRDKLEAGRLKLVQAHYADALDLLKAEQDRIRTSLDAITGRLDSLTTHLQQGS